MSNYLRKGKVVCRNKKAPSKEKFRRILEMKKVLSFVLVLTLVLGSFSMVFAASDTRSGSQLTDIADSANADAIIANCDLGIITGYTDGSFKPDQSVTRAEFAAMLTRMLGVPDSALTGYAKTSFTDMSGYGWANSYIGFCEAKGIINGYGDGTFGPGRTVTVNEAITMTLRAIGYTNNSSELVGAWPSNYVTLGKRLGLYDDVATTTTIDRGSAAQVIYNALTCTVVAVDADGKTTDAYVDKDTKNAKTVIEVYLDCTPTGWIVYTKGDADDSVINTMSYIGAYVKAFRNDDDDVIAIAEVKSTFLTGDYTEADDEFETDDVTYDLVKSNINYKDEDNDTQATQMFVNGKNTTTGNAFDEDGTYTIAAKVSGKTIKEVYSISKWTAEEAFLFENDMLDTEDNKLDGYTFVEDDNGSIDEKSFALLGVSSLNDIKEDNVVEVYLETPEDSDTDIVRIEVGTETVEGKITVVNTDGDEFTIGGKVYSIADSFSADEDDLTKASLGDTGTAYLNYKGEIALWKVEDADAENYAIVTDTVTNVGRDDTIILLDKNGEEKEYVLTDDAKKDDGEEDSEFTGNGKTSVGALEIGDLVTFSLDRNGKIDSLEYLAYTGSNVSDKEVNKNRTLFGNSKLDNGVVVFSYDDNTLADSDFAVLNLADVETEKELQGTYYYMDGSSIAVMLIKDKYTGADSIYAVINSALAGYNADDDKAFKVEGFANGKAYTGWTADRNTGDLKAEFDAAKIEVYKLTIDSNDVITDAEITTGEAFVADAPINGDITDKDGNYLIQVEGTWYTIDPNAVVYSYSVADKEFDTAKLSDIKKERNSIEASTVYLYQMDDDSEVVDFIIIYDDDNAAADDSEQPENPDESQTETPDSGQTGTPEGGAGN